MKLATSSHVDPTKDKDLILDTAHIIRLAASLVFGVVGGLSGLYGVPTLVLFGVASTLVVILYMRRVLDIDDFDDWGGPKAVLSEGLAPSVALFVLVWTIVYSTQFNQ